MVEEKPSRKYLQPKRTSGIIVWVNFRKTSTRMAELFAYAMDIGRDYDGGTGIQPLTMDLKDENGNICSGFMDNRNKTDGSHMKWWSTCSNQYLKEYLKDQNQCFLDVLTCKK